MTSRNAPSQQESAAVLAYATPQRPQRWLVEIRIMAWIIFVYCIVAASTIWFEVLRRWLDPQFGVTVTFGKPSPLKAYHVDVSPWPPLCAAASGILWIVVWRKSGRAAERVFAAVSVFLGGLMILPCAIW